MSQDPSRVTDRHFDYLRARTVDEGALLNELRAAARHEGLPSISIAPEQGAFLAILLEAVRAREVVEVGTLGGYSAIWMARGIGPQGRVRTIELDPAHAAFARRWISRSDVAGRIDVLEGDARAILPTLGEGTADAAFIDADKEGYSRYLDECVRILRPGGLVLCDNAFAFGQLFDDEPDDAGVPVIRRFNDAVAARSDLRAIIVPFGDGLWVGVKTARARPLR
jgi:predicted O-methyltransferase YrrM